MDMYTLLKQRLGSGFTVTYDNGREASGRITCECGTDVRWTACIDVGGVWLWCPHCGMIDT
jgi:hypothetical protein